MNYIVRLAVAGALTLTAVPAAAQVEGLRFLNPKPTPMPAAPKDDELPSDLRAYLPQAPKAWKRDGAFDELGMFDPRKSATQGYSRVDGKDGGLTLEIKLPSGLNASRLLGTGGGKRKLGPDDEVPTKIVSEVEVNGLKGYLTFDSAEGVGELELGVGRCDVKIDGYGATGADLVALARKIDTARLAKL
ncbi:MAG: hypothetical protein KBC34_00515 [Phenylobacterium sp.]|nr:hypothetical protein [Phenylobacterium sp.]